jgi:methyltransferase (TIGR00027 family)
VFEVDHPATQARKRAALGNEGRAAYSGFDFEAQPAAALPDALASHGHRRNQPTLTLWEGVTMYLTEEAIDSTLAAVRAYSAPGSRIVFTYFEKDRMLRHRGLSHRLLRRFVASVGEPFRFGWDPNELPAWLKARGFELLSDRTEEELARSLLPPEAASRVEGLGRHVAVAGL